MEILENKDLVNIKGGVNTALWFGIGAAITFILGLFHGIVSPRKCNR